MWFLSNDLYHSLLFLCKQRECSTLFHAFVCTVKCKVKGNQKKGTSNPLEGTLGMGGAPGYVLPPLTYASVDESVRNDTSKWP